MQGAGEIVRSARDCFGASVCVMTWHGIVHLLPPRRKLFGIHKSGHFDGCFIVQISSCSYELLVFRSSVRI